MVCSPIHRRRCRRDAMQVTYAVLGFVFACLSAILIIASVQPLPQNMGPRHVLGHQHHPQMMHFASTGTHGNGTMFVTEHTGLAFGNKDCESTSTSSLADVDSSSSNDDCETTEAVKTASKSRTLEETIEDNDSGRDHTTATRTIPAIMVGVSSSIIFCALLLYCSDVRDRCRNDKHGDDYNEDSSNDDNDTFKSCKRGRDEGSMTSVSSAGASDFSGIWMDETPPSMLPPMDEQRDDMVDCENGQVSPDDLSISHVSTLTDPVEGEETSKEAQDDKGVEVGDYDNKSDPEKVMPVQSDCSSLTSGSATTLTENLAGEDCLEEEDNEIDMEKTSAVKDTPNSKACSLELSRNTCENLGGTQEEERDAADEDKHGASPKRESAVPHELTQLEKIAIPSGQAEDCPPHSSTIGPNSDRVLRDIYFLPISKGSKGTIGLAVQDATSDSTHPIVTGVEASSSFLGRIFEGDSVVKINGTNTAGLSGAQMLNMLEGVADDNASEDGSTQGVEEMLKMVKVTVLSSETDGASLSDDGHKSLDLGMPDTCVEV